MKNPPPQDPENVLVSLRRRIAFYEDEVRRHPLAAMIRRRKLPPSGEKAFALYLFMDSWMWPPMLISMRDHAAHPALRRAIEDNLQDEAGKRGISHIKLCLEFLRSIGVAPALVDAPELNRTINVSCGLSQPCLAGWLAAAEMLTLPLYEVAKDCFGSRPGADLRYLDVHMRVDEDHIQWLWGAVEALVKESSCADEVIEGIALGARATLKSLDEIYEEALADSRPPVSAFLHGSRGAASR